MRSAPKGSLNRLSERANLSLRKGRTEIEGRFFAKEGVGLHRRRRFTAEEGREASCKRSGKKTADKFPATVQRLAKSTILKKRRTSRKKAMKQKGEIRKKNIP